MLDDIGSRLDSALEEDDERGIHRVARDIFTDPELFELEMKHIFEGNWIYLAHESQIPNKNDYFTTYMGRQPIVIARNRGGELNAFINACSHRGAMLCRHKRGNKSTYTCPFHGWTFSNAGKLLKVKEPEGAGYPDCFNKEGSHDLTKVARFESYRGFLFGSLNPDVVPLAEFLGEAGKIIDLIVDQAPEGLKVLRGSSTYVYDGNGKLQTENGADGYHVSAVHWNYAATTGRRKEAEQVDNVRTMSAGGGWRGCRRSAALPKACGSPRHGTGGRSGAAGSPAPDPGPTWRPEVQASSLHHQTGGDGGRRSPATRSRSASPAAGRRPGPWRARPAGSSPPPPTCQRAGELQPLDLGLEQLIRPARASRPWSLRAWIERAALDGQVAHLLLEAADLGIPGISRMALQGRLTGGQERLPPATQLGGRHLELARGQLQVLAPQQAEPGVLLAACRHPPPGRNPACASVLGALRRNHAHPDLLVHPSPPCRSLPAKRVSRICRPGEPPVSHFRPQSGSGHQEDG
jgi:phenylpropionate dioxygenase-like ring-hydroxylating dioxygenase large terminal subunit